MAITLFPSKGEAEQAARTLAGWDVAVVRYTSLEGQAGWVIQATAPGSHGQPTYLHDDGFIR